MMSITDSSRAPTPQRGPSTTPLPTFTRRLDVLDGLREIDWRKANSDWQGICMVGNEVVTRVPTRRATANYIKWKLGLEAERPAPVITDDQQRRYAAPSATTTN